MPHLAQELHRGRGQGVVLGEAQLGGEDAALEGRALGALDQRLPVEQVVLGDGARRDALGRVVGQRAVLLEEAAVGGGLRHGGGRESETAGTGVEVACGRWWEVGRCKLLSFRRSCFIGTVMGLWYGPAERMSSTEARGRDGGFPKMPGGGSVDGESALKRPRW